MTASTGIAARAEVFARQHIAGRHDLDGTEFPPDLWRALGREGFLGVALPPEVGGSGADTATMVALGRALVRGGGSLGVASSVLSHNTVAHHFIQGFGTAEQQARYLPDLAAGRITLSVAISELGAGAHPKHLQTSAERRGDQVVLNGVKAYVTNGPLAQLFVVLAISAIEDGRKNYSAYLVPLGTPGLTLTQASGVDFLRPSPHCGLALAGCAVPLENRLGDGGTAYEIMAIPLRTIEEVHGLGARIGGLHRELDLLAADMAAAPADEAITAFGAMAAEIAGMSALGEAVIAAFDAGTADRPALLLALRGQLRRFQADFQALRDRLALAPNPGLDRFQRDMVGLANIARYVDEARLKAMGAERLRAAASKVR